MVREAAPPEMGSVEEGGGNLAGEAAAAELAVLCGVVRARPKQKVQRVQPTMVNLPSRCRGLHVRGGWDVLLGCLAACRTG